VTGDWFSLACGTSGTRTPSDGNVTVTGGPTVFTLDPDSDFAGQHGGGLHQQLHHAVTAAGHLH
jgi:hypothetical protein